jgi:hypothetical protein
MDNSVKPEKAAINQIVVKIGPPEKPYAKVILPDKRIGRNDRRQHHTYIADDRRSGIIDRRKP